MRIELRLVDSLDFRDAKMFQLENYAALKDIVHSEPRVVCTTMAQGETLLHKVLKSTVMKEDTADDAAYLFVLHGASLTQKDNLDVSALDLLNTMETSRSPGKSRRGMRLRQRLLSSHLQGAFKSMGAVSLTWFKRNDRAWIVSENDQL